jgi:hypothetical protein
VAVRSLVAALLVVVGCSATDAESADAGERGCQYTECVAGATCTVPSGAVCRCVEAEVWRCEDPARVGVDAGFELDSDPYNPFDASGASDAVLPDAYVPVEDTADAVVHSWLDLDGCFERRSACEEDSGVGGGEPVLRIMLQECFLSCTRASLEISPNGCPARVWLNVEWVEGGLACVAERIERYRWPCAELQVITAQTTSCPD